MWLDELHKACAKGIAEWLKQTVNTSRQIKTLTWPELKAMAAACEAAWIVSVAKRLSAPPAQLTDAERDAYLALLMG